MIDKKLKPVVQGGVDNYLGKQPQVQAPRKWQSSPDKPATELAYITEAEKDLILKANIHGGLEGGPNMGPSGIMSLDSFGDVGGAGASGGDTDAGGGYNTGAGGGGFSGRNTNTTTEREFDKQKQNQRAALQIAERAQANRLGYNERANIANATYGPLQKYTGERGFLGNLFRGANKYGYTDTYTSGPNQGQVKPGYAGRILGGLGSILTGIPFVGGALGTAYDYGKGIFSPKQRDMSQFNKLGLGGVNPATLDFDSNAQINQNVDTTGYSRFSDAALGKPDLNNLESLINSYTGGSIDFNPGMTVGYGTGIENVNPSVTESYASASDLPAEFQDMATYAGNYSQNAVSKQLYGEEYDVLDPFTQQQIDSLIDQVGTKSTGELARNGGIMGYGRG